MTNNFFYTIEAINAFIKGKIMIGTLGYTSYKRLKIKYLEIDSRKIIVGQHSLFFALEGGNVNGHLFINDAYQKGVRAFVVNTAYMPDFQILKNAVFIQTNNVLRALQVLAQCHRQHIANPQLQVVSITGSNGKTIVKEWIAQLLHHNKHLFISPQSYNSQIGVPLSVWQLQANHTLAIFEAGISTIQEMKYIAPIINCDIGIFTNIGTAHNEGFTSITEKIHEKLQLFKTVKFLIYNADYQQITDCIQNLKNEPYNIKNNFYSFQTFTFSTQKNENATIQVIEKFFFSKKTFIKYSYQNQIFELTLPFSNPAYLENALHVLAFLLHIGYTNHYFSANSHLLTPLAMRLELKAGQNHCTLINDCYSCDIHALSIALHFLAQQNEAPNKTVILSDVLQSGENNEALYNKIANMLAQNKVTKFIGIGKYILNFKYIFEKKISQTYFFETTDLFLQNPIFFEKETILIKGARQFEFEKIAKKLAQKQHNTALEINLNAIEHNLKIYKSLLQPTTKVMAMVKSVSYGSGVYEIANILQYNNVDYLSVAYTDEGVALRKAGIRLPIMVMNPEPHTFEQLLTYNLEPEIYSLQHLQALTHFLEKTPPITPLFIHLKIDTGMHRLGFEKKDINNLIFNLLNNKYITIKSIFSHLAAADNPNLDYFTLQQIAEFEAMFADIQQHFNYFIMRHIANSAGITRFKQAHFDMVRLGIGLYGIDSSKTIQNKLLTVSTLKTYIAQIKIVAPPQTVGYSRKGKVKKTTVIATLNIGYADGLNRRLSNGKGKVLINNTLASIIGNICMDMCMADITHIPTAEVGDEVIIFGENMPIQEIANTLQTISYEVFTSISARVKRIYFKE